MIEGTFIFAAYRWCNIGRAYICTQCGHQWARMRNIGSGFTTIAHTCPGCRSPWPNEVPGSLADPIERAMDGHGLAHIPSELLSHELDRVADWLLTSPTQSANITPTESLTYELQMTPIADRIAELRAKVLAKTITDPELREAIGHLRADRTGASVRRIEAKKAKVPVDVSALLTQLMGQPKP